MFAKIVKWEKGLRLEEKVMKCINNTSYEGCLTLNKRYMVAIEYLSGRIVMYHFIDDEGGELQTHICRFEEVVQ